jgi:uncharacterized membrane protein YfcA
MAELDVIMLLGAALFAGFVDAVAGGGGLIQVPALLVALPAESPATVFGTNKLASIFGTGNAALRYARRISLPWGLALPAAVTAFGFSFAGAMAVAWLPKEVVRPLVLGMLVLVLVYTVVKPEFGVVPGIRLSPGQERPRALLMGAVLGFYDGFFGPGAGSFMIFAFVHWFRLDFLHEFRHQRRGIGLLRAQRACTLDRGVRDGSVQHCRCGVGFATRVASWQRLRARSVHCRSVIVDRSPWI